jgi:hypothetical protein
MALFIWGIERTQDHPKLEQKDWREEATRGRKLVIGSCTIWKKSIPTALSYSAVVLLPKGNDDRLLWHYSPGNYLESY